MFTKEELFSKYKIAKNKLKAIKEKTYNYKIKGGAGTPYGDIRNLDFKEVVKTMSTVETVHTNTKNVVDTLGLTEQEIKEIGGYDWVFNSSYNNYVHDCKLRIEELRDKHMKTKWESVVKKIEANLSDEDKFLLDMEYVDSLDMDFNE